MPRYEYLVFPAQQVNEYFEVTWHNGAYKSEGLLDAQIKQALADGFRWVRTDGEFAVFEKESQP